MHDRQNISRIALVIDDEMSGRTMIEFYIQEQLGDIITRVISVSSLQEAKEVFLMENVFIVFTDIELHNEIGLEITHFIPEDVPLVVVSAHSQYALKAIQVDAFDYLLKPLSEIEVLRFKSKLKKWLKDKKIDEVTDDDEERLIIKDSGENIIIPVGEIIYLEACGAYSKIHTEDRNFIASKTLKNIEDLLPRSFLRVHRSFIVPLERINSYTNNTVCLKDGRNISLSKSGKKLLQAYL